QVGQRLNLTAVHQVLAHDQRRLGVAHGGDAPEPDVAGERIEQAGAGHASDHFELTGGGGGDHQGAAVEPGQLHVEALLGEVPPLDGEVEGRTGQDRVVAVADHLALDGRGGGRRGPTGRRGTGRRGRRRRGRGAGARRGRAWCARRQ